MLEYESKSIEELKIEYKTLLTQRYHTMGTIAVDDEIVEIRNARIKELSKILENTTE